MLDAREEAGVLHIVAAGKVHEADYDGLVPLFEGMGKREAGPVRMPIELAPDFSGWDLAGFWRDVKVDIAHQDRFGRIAIVGDKAWEEWGTKLSAPLFPSADMRFFDRAGRDEAEAWVRSGGAASA